MTATRTINRSFAGGEITPELFGRSDLVKFVTGLALCKNMRVLPHGPVTMRDGFEFVNEVRDSTKQTRLVPFVLSDTVAYLLEFDDQAIRFHTNGGTVVEAAKAITGVTQASPGVVTVAGHGYTSGQWVNIQAVSGMTQLNDRYLKVVVLTVNTFSLQTLGGADISTAAFPVYAGGGTASRVYEIASTYLEADLFNLHYAQATTKLSLAHQTYPPRELVITAPTNWALNTVSFAISLGFPSAVVATATVNAGAGVTSMKYTYSVSALDDEGNEGLAVAGAPVQNNLYTAGNRNRIVFTAVAGATRYRCYRTQQDSLGAGSSSPLGAISEIATPDLEFADDNVAPDSTVTPQSNQTVFASPTNYPAAVSYFEQRRVFAGTVTDPQTTWLTRSGSDTSMARSGAVRDDDSIKFRAAAREANSIKHVVPLDDMLLFTGSAVWRAFSNNSDALTPSNVTVRPIAYAAGASMVQPVTTSASVLYEENGTGHLLELKYSLERGGYETTDASIMAPHLVNGYTLRDLTFATGRSKTAWAVRSDGLLLGVTYVPSQEVLGWHQHTTTNGVFESVCALREGTEDAVYAVVRRVVNGRSVRYIERMKSRATVVINDSFYVDAGKTYSGVATTTVSNLHHLEGQVVSILADGIVQPQQTVTGGAITLSLAASKITVGLPIIAQGQLLPLSVIGDSAVGLGGTKNISRVDLRVKDSSGFEVGPTFTTMRPYKQRTSEAYGSPTALYTGVAPVTIDGTWNLDGQVCFQQRNPLPFMVTAVALEVEYGD